MDPFRCPCGGCSIEVYLANQCSKDGEKPFPYLDTKHLDEASKIDLEAKLSSDVEEIRKKFANLVCSTCTSLINQKTSPRILAQSALSIGATDSTAFPKPPTLSLLQQHEAELKSAECIASIFLILQPAYMMFFNYEILEHIINDLGTDEDKKKLAVYLKDFDQFCKRSVFEVPPNVFGHLHKKRQEQKAFAVKYGSDDDSDHDSHISLEKVKHAQKKIAKKAGLSTSSLYLCRVDEGCVQLTFLIPAFILDFLEIQSFSHSRFELESIGVFSNFDFVQTSGFMRALSNRSGTVWDSDRRYLLVSE